MKLTAITASNYYHKIKETGRNTTGSFLPPSCNSLCADKVTFSGTPKNLFIKDMRELPSLGCGCCGIKMLKNSSVNNFLNRKIYYPASIALKRIKIEKYFNESHASEEMKEAYNHLKEYAEQYPHLTINDILAKRTVKDKRKQLPKEVSQAFDEIREITKLVAHNSKYMVDEITKLNPDFHKIEKRVFKELQSLAQDYPDETFFNILNKPQIKKIYLTKLQDKQLNVLKIAEEAAQNLPDNLKVKIIENIEKSRNIFTEESGDILHKRSRVISSFNSIFSTDDKSKIAGEEIMQIINQLPDSKTDVNSFLIKGAQKSSNAIVEILLSRVRSTYEHVKPHHREGDNGASNISNYIALCGKCNSERQRTGYDIFTQLHPEMIDNAQAQIDKIIYFINSGILIGHDNYPQKIQKALDIESKGKIKVNIDKLDITKAKINRKLRQEVFAEEQKRENKKPKIFKFGKGYFYKKILQKPEKHK